ncbi:MAG TPA: acyl-CoA thioesterase domain-containing protein [Myxococcota bacterium]|jgi:acyl-CoA thioesterase-2
MSGAASPRENLAEMLRVERVREGEFSACCESFWGSVLGGDLLARAALAAASSCERLALRSLHAGFLRPAPPGRRLALRVEPLADDASGARRQVRIEGDGLLLCQVVASFAPPEKGLAYQDAQPTAELPPPEALPSTLEQARAEGWADYARGPIEFRRARPRIWPDPTGDTSGPHVEWVLPRAPLGDDPRLQMAALVFLADFYSHWPFERRVGRGFAVDRFQTLDLSLWVHQPARWDDWWLLEMSSEVAHAGRGLSRGRIYTRDGRLIASTAQEALISSA